MRHDIALSGFAFALRPVELADADFITALRAPSARTRFLNRDAGTVDAQRAWLEAYFARPGDYYFVVHALNGGTDEGLLGLYDVDAAARTAEWGRWLLREGSSAAVESALLVYRCVFERLHLDSVHCRTLADNAQVVSFHDSCGLVRAPREVIIRVDGKQQPAVEHSLARAQWPVVEERLTRIAQRQAAAFAARH